MKYIAVYHSPCQDGLSAAWVFNKWAVEQSHNFELIKGDYTNNNLLQQLLEIANKKVKLFFLDFCLPKDAILQLADKAHDICIIDHHKSAQTNMQDLDKNNVKCEFDMGHSGCVLTWKHFYKKETPPLFLKYVEDKDIWAKKLPGIDEFTAWLDVRSPETITDIEKIIFDFPNSQEEFCQSRPYRHGATVVTYKNQLVKDMFGFAVHTEICGVPAIKINSSLLKVNSELGFQAARHFKKIAWIWYETINADGIPIQNNSLRSNEELADVSEIARQLGGGGHRDAAGFVGHGKK